MLPGLLCSFLCIVSAMDAPAVRRFAVSTLAEYSHSSYHVIMALERSPAADAPGRRIIRWEPLRTASLPGEPEEVAMAFMLSAVVHGACHEYAAGAGEGGLLLFTGNSDRRVRMASGFPVREMRTAVPSRFRGRAYRAYASGPAADARGIYSFLEELVAHYHGARTAHDMLRWYGRRHSRNARTWAAFSGAVDSSLDGGIALELYLLCLLRHAHIHSPEIYRAVMRDPEFRAVLRETRRNRRLLAEEHYNAPAFLALVKGAGIDGAELRPRGRNEYLLFYENGKSVWIPVPRASNRYASIREELAGGAYDGILKELAK